MNTHLSELCQRLPQLQDVTPDISAAANLCSATFAAGGTLYLCGNGGSRSDADHIAGELMKGFLRRRALAPAERRRFGERFGTEGEALGRSLQGGLRAIVLGAESALTTAVSNDTDPDLIFAQPLYVLGRPGDVLLALSTSGNARNVAMACRVAALRDMSVIALTGRSGGQLRELAQVCIRVPAEKTFLVQELHLPVYHCLCAMLEETFFPD